MELHTPVLRICVSDTGPGIPAHLVPRLTERFFRVDGHRSLNAGGTGLGLAICTRLVTALNGRITVKSDLGEGSLFFVHLPNELISNTSSKPTPFKVFSFAMQTNFRKPLNL